MPLAPQLDQQRLTSPKQGELRHDELVSSLERKVGQIEEMQQHLAQSKAKLLGMIETIKARPEGMACSENTERVLALFKHA